MPLLGSMDRRKAWIAVSFGMFFVVFLAGIIFLLIAELSPQWPLADKTFLVSGVISIGSLVVMFWLLRLLSKIQEEENQKFMRDLIERIEGENADGSAAE